jgi:hypothetical protein
MENSFQTSFIPKKPIDNVRKARTTKTGFLTILGVFLLIVTGAAAGGLFLYKNSLEQKESALSASLEQASVRFNKDTIAQLELYNKRVGISRPILENHLVLSPLFTLVGDLTIPSIQYTKFDHFVTDQGFTVRMSGIARDYKSIALQADSFNGAKGGLLKNVVFSNLTRDSKNNVTFDVEFMVDPTLLSYTKSEAQSEDEEQASVTNPVVLPQTPQ